MTSKRTSAAAAPGAINRAWLESRFDDLTALIHEDIVLVPPGWEARIVGREAFVSGLREFMQIAVVHEFTEHEVDVDVVGDTAVAAYRYDMRYEREGTVYRASGRDVYVLRQAGSAWIAVWRTMVDIEEQAEA